eukprot:GHVU01169265.1.p1 GENE.GHVU01169265.1~~GHVU01169265.1.p1  ORF type:complete len:103 (+),score=2.14 GHVU01169265.1:442-750(+)
MEYYAVFISITATLSAQKIVDAIYEANIYYNCRYGDSSTTTYSCNSSQYDNCSATAAPRAISRSVNNRTGAKDHQPPAEVYILLRWQLLQLLNVFALLHRLL